jgi:hypothetical protein
MTKDDELQLLREDRRGPSRRCPICGAPAVHRYRPFCSRRCADIDLGRWFKESYRVPGVPPDRAEDSDKSGPD